MKIEIEVDDLTDDGLNAALSFISGGIPKAFTTDWSSTGPLIERFGVGLTFSKPDSQSAEIAAVINREDPALWMASIQAPTKYVMEWASTPLGAAVKALVAASGMLASWSISIDKLTDIVRNEWVIARAILAGSDCHEATPLKTDPNTYELQANSGPEALLDFQRVVAAVSQLNCFVAVKKHIESDSGFDYVDILLVKHVG